MTRIAPERLPRGAFVALVALTVLLVTPTGLALAQATGPTTSSAAPSYGLVPHPAPPAPAGTRPSHGPLFPISGPCDGPFPAFAGIGPYPAGCVGRDQAVVGFYSGLAGSAGNFSLALSLPSDRGPTANQSDLYRAVWVGIVLSDPSAWMSQCFLEIRFQPDSAYAPNGSLVRSPNNWTASAVGIAIDPQSSTEDSCFDQPLLRAGGGNGTYFTAAGGDALNLTASGWAGSTTGEQFTVVDTTTGARGQVLGVMAQGTPLNPAFSASDVSDAAAFAAAEILPVSFGVELAGGANPSVPSNSSFRGCSPGVPPSTHVDPAVPCPSYDPGSWVNDTAAPLRVGIPSFSSGGATATSAEFEFSSTVGGPSGVLSLSNATCTGRIGSSFCTYPWFSYSCGVSALEFGATDFSGVTNDFGKDAQFPTTQSPGLVGHGQFSAADFGVPLCGAPGYTVSVGA